MILSNPFNEIEFTDFIKGFLPDLKIDRRKIDIGTSGFSNVVKLGDSTTLATSVLIVRSKKNVNSRISLTNNSFKILKTHNIYRALIVYVNDDDSIWRFSLLTAIPTFDHTGKVVINYSNPRRHSYVLGSDVGIATARKYLSKLGPITDFANLQFRFSVEAVNKDFYSEISGHFYDLVGKYGDKNEVLKKPLLELPNKDVSIESLQNYSVRLLGRLIFLWFLKQKRSSSGHALLPTELLTGKNLEFSEILHDLIEPLFFEVLNKQVPLRASKFQEGMYGQVPYMNGGLFHASDGDAGDYYDSKNLRSRIRIPNDWFTGFFNTLDVYNFTIDENLENDVDLSIDPEMLGRVFENLLAEINPETGQIARKSTGSYYTPRAIVNFMVDESLNEYLMRKTSIEEEKIRAVISTSKHDDLEFPLNSKERTKIVSAITELRVLDPACGSGAFPMGMLQKLLWVISQVDPDGDEYLDIQDMEGTEHWLSVDRLDYLRKRKIIRDVIFGTDIQSVAVEIAKLRCFLTLIVDQEIDDDTPNRGVVPLPNLDFKFICADSLTPLESSEQISIGDDPDLEKKLASIRRRYFTTTNEEKKKKFRDDFEKLVTKDPTLFAESKRNSQLKSFRPLASNNQAKFLDLNTMFGIDGFPIVIGNPPYKVLEGPDSKEALENLRTISTYSYALGGKLNLYRHFIERSQQFLAPDGVLSFIVPSTLIADKNTQGIRQLFKEKGALRFVIEFPEKEKVFESVTQATTVFLFKNGDPSKSFRLSVGLNKAILPPESSALIGWDEVVDLFGESLTFPLVNSEAEFDVFKHLFTSSKPLKSFAKCYKGDINLGYFKDQLRSQPSTNVLVRGDHISNYKVDLSLNRTDRRWIEMKSVLSASLNSRIVCQNVANMGLKQRLTAGIIPRDVVVADSANCIEINSDLISKEEILALINSKLLNWYFKRTSTNNHVNIYELENLPIRSFEDSVKGEVKSLVLEIIQISESDGLISERKIAIQNRLDELVFDLYGLDPIQVSLVAGKLVS